MNFWECNEKLKKAENWTDELIYVHRTRLVMGVILGLLFAGILRILLG